MAIKIAISKPTKDVLSITSPDDFYLNSDYALLKIHAFGTFSIDSPGGHVLATITHSLGYKPFCIVYSQYCNSDGSVTSEYYQCDWDVLLGTEIFGYSEITTTELQVRVGFGAGNGSRAILGFYYIFKEKAAS